MLNLKITANMKKYVLFALIALFCVSSSAWADTAYVKLTYGNVVS